MVRTTTRWVLVGALAAAGALVVAAPPTGPVAAQPASSVDVRISVRLVGMDGATTTGVISATGSAAWNGNTGYAALKAERISGNQYRVSGSSIRQCPGTSTLVVPDGVLSRGATGDRVAELQAVLGALGYDVGPVDGEFGQMTENGVRAFQSAEELSVSGTWTNTDATRARQRLAETGGSGWTELGTTNGAATFTTAGNESTMAPGDTLGVCLPNGQVVHYRGDIVAVTDNSGGARTVNQVGIESYLRGVVPREVSAGWGNAGGGAGMNALRAQAVGARSYALSQNRYSYAKTCDTTACQAYGGAAIRPGAAAAATTREHPNTDRAIAETAGAVRVWPDGSLVSTEYSASNGPRTAGGAFPAVDDAGDSIPANPNHRWTRVMSAGDLASRYSLGTLASATTPTSSSMTNQGFQGIWANFVRLQNSTGTTRTRTAWEFRGDLGFPSPGFQFRTVTTRPSSQSFAFIGDSVGESILSPLRTMVTGSFSGIFTDAIARRCTTVRCSNVTSGLEAAAKVPVNTDLVIVGLGYNDPSSFGPKITAMMNALNDRGVKHVAWVNLSTRSNNSNFAGVNSALAAAARGNSKLSVLDWNSHSSGAQRNRWFTDNVHLTATGRAEFALFVNDAARSLTSGSSSSEIRAVVAEGVGFGHGRGMSQWGAYGWAVNHGWDWRRILDHYYGGTLMGDVATAVDRIQIINPGQSSNPNTPQDFRVRPDNPLKVSFAGRDDVPPDAVAVALNVTAVEPEGPGYLTVWPCGSPMPEASNVNYSGGGAEPNAVLVQLDDTREVCVYSYARSHVLIDLSGSFTAGFSPLVPNRLADTRGSGRVTPGEPLQVSMADVDGVPEDAVAVALNVTAVEPTGPGFLTVWPCGSPMPEASNVNYSGGGAEPNAVLVQLDETREVCIYTFAPSHVLVDLSGSFTEGFEPIVPDRVTDTRGAGRVEPGQPLQVRLADHEGVPDGAVAVALNVTAVEPTGPGFLTVWPCGSPMPEASNVNYSGGGAEPNAVLVQLDDTGEVCVYTYASSHIVVDLSGSFTVIEGDDGPMVGFEPIVPDRVRDTRQGG